MKAHHPMVARLVSCLTNHPSGKIDGSEVLVREPETGCSVIYVRVVHLRYQKFIVLKGQYTMKKIKKKFTALCKNASHVTTDMSIKFMSAVKSRSGASLWEYLLVIVIVCVLGAGLINVISGEQNGIAALWTQLYAKFTQLVNIGVSAT